MFDWIIPNFKLNCVIRSVDNFAEYNNEVSNVAISFFIRVVF